MQLQSLGITTICAIQQPRVAVFQCFSHLCLLAPGGRLVYSNETKGIQRYLEGLGFQLPASENVADWMLDCIAGAVKLKNTRNEVIHLSKMPPDITQRMKEDFGAVDNAALLAGHWIDVMDRVKERERAKASAEWGLVAGEDGEEGPPAEEASYLVDVADLLTTSQFLAIEKYGDMLEPPTPPQSESEGASNKSTAAARFRSTVARGPVRATVAGGARATVAGGIDNNPDMRMTYSKKTHRFCYKVEKAMRKALLVVEAKLGIDESDSQALQEPAAEVVITLDLFHELCETMQVKFVTDYRGEGKKDLLAAIEKEPLSEEDQEVIVPAIDKPSKKPGDKPSVDEMERPPSAEEESIELTGVQVQSPPPL